MINNFKDDTAAGSDCVSVKTLVKHKSITQSLIQPLVYILYTYKLINY